MARKLKPGQPRLSVLLGGRKDDPAPPPEPDLNTPAGKFAKALDTFVRQQMTAANELDPMEVLAALLQLGAAVAVELGGSQEEYEGACGEMFRREHEVRKGGNGADPAV